MVLLDPPNHYHWSRMLVTSVVAPESHLFASPPYEEESVMGGMVIKNPADGKH